MKMFKVVLLVISALFMSSCSSGIFIQNEGAYFVVLTKSKYDYDNYYYYNIANISEDSPRSKTVIITDQNWTIGQHLRLCPE